MKKIAKNYKFFRLFWIFIIGSIAGFLYENILVLLQKGYFELRQGLIYSPLIPVYGIGAIIYELIIPKLKSPLKVFLYTMFFGAAVEYISSYVQEVLFGTISWNYTWVTINFNGRTSLLHAFYWGTAGLIFYEIIHPLFDKLLSRNITKTVATITMVLVVFITFDIIISCSAVARQKKRMLKIPASTRIDKFLDDYYPDEVIDRVYTNKVVTINKNI